MNAPAHIGSLPSSKSKAFGPIERRIATRYLRAKKSQGGVGLIAAISFSCIMLAIAAMIIIMSIMNGFRGEVIRLTIGSEGHMYVKSAQAQPDPATIEQLEARLAALPGIKESFQFTQHYTGVQANGQFSLAQVIGIRADNLRRYDLIADSVIAGSFDGFGQGGGANNQIALGSHMASSLGLNVGDRLTVYSPRTRQTISGPVPIRKTYTVGAIFEVGLILTDQTYLYMSLEQSTLLFEGGVPTGEIQLRLDNPDAIDDFYTPISNAAGEPVFISTWRDRNATTATALRTEQIAMRFIFMIVVIIAAFPVLSSMIMLVKNKSKDIAILRTIGATQGSILRIFFMSGAMIGILGTLAGLVVGILFCLNIGGIQWVIEQITGQPLFPEDVYQLSGGIPSKLVWSEVFGVAFWGFLISAAATFFPARSASKIDPVDALRYE